ncbi:enoyl-CoA hydratase/carnithine racemase [Saccharothrix ecbatanensis]|uniref:Enoyl-CoA hydratase/carnithine racemase n=1 Tax=Saccharothrix ecbatanensis TaxID=1105145 RepID=A0A7W9M229_9PSEU|nr:enoyl-CoA hydratase/isomerase family protein [Saccharothrix ecbatanensis]MBB5804584.1 enoyl-CoA hydratase/carnithine racemase [Saccharothrix ecbatanensis]
MAVSLELSCGIAVIRIEESPDALLPDVRALLNRAVDARAIVLLVEGGVCGDDIKRLVRSSAAQREAVSAALRGVREELANLPVPLVAAIRGSASGEAARLAMGCDLRVLASDGGLGRVTGDRVLVARRVTAAEALRTGLVDRVVPSAAVVRTAVELANECKSAQAVRKSCRIVAP